MWNYMKKLLYAVCITTTLLADNNPGGTTITNAAIRDLTGIDVPKKINQLLSPANRAFLETCAFDLSRGPIPLETANQVLALLRLENIETEIVCDQQTHENTSCATMDTCTAIARANAPTQAQGQPLVEWFRARIP
jgi:hypothetical protein